MPISIANGADVKQRIDKLEARIRQAEHLISQGGWDAIIHGRPAPERLRLDRFAIKRWYRARDELRAKGEYRD